MRINAHLYHKADDYRAEPCEIEKIIEVSGDEFTLLYQNPLRDFDFIAENKSGLACDENGVNHCMLVLGEGSEDGILICPEGYDYARYSTHIPNARQIAAQEQAQKILPFPSERTAHLLDRLLDWLDDGFNHGTMYDVMSGWMGMTDEEIRSAGFDSLFEGQGLDEDEDHTLTLQ